MKWCQTDLAANAYSWPRFMKDDMRFGILETGRGANHDGIMADLVRTRGWKVKIHVKLPSAFTQAGVWSI